MNKSFRLNDIAKIEYEPGPNPHEADYILDIYSIDIMDGRKLTNTDITFNNREDALRVRHLLNMSATRIVSLRYSFEDPKLSLAETGTGKVISVNGVKL